MKINEIYPNLYHLTFESRYEETMTFIRLQEFYESPFPEIHGKYFTLEQYMDRYAKWKGNFTYCTDWCGFNVPGNVVLKFKTVFTSAGRLREKEQELFDLLQKTVDNLRTGDFYIIGTYDDTDGAHEMSHGLFYLNKKYRDRMTTLIDFRNVQFRKMKKQLLDMGYAKSVVVDEIQAYLATSTDEFLQKNPYINDMDLIKQFRRIFKQYTRRKK